MCVWSTNPHPSRYLKTCSTGTTMAKPDGRLREEEGGGTVTLLFFSFFSFFPHCKASTPLQQVVAPPSPFCLHLLPHEITSESSCRMLQCFIWHDDLRIRCSVLFSNFKIRGEQLFIFSVRAWHNPISQSGSDPGSHSTALPIHLELHLGPDFVLVWSLFCNRLNIWRRTFQTLSDK